MGETKQLHYTQAKSWQIALWPLHHASNNVNLVLMMFAGYIAAGGYGLAVATAGIITTYSRVLDAITDPLLALVSERLNTRFGKVRLLSIIGRLVQTLALLSMFFWGLGNGIVLYTVIYSVYIVGNTISSLATNTANPILTTDPKQRPRIFRWTMVYTVLVSTFTSVYMSNVLFPRYGSLSVGAMQELCLTVVIIGVVFETLACIAISEKDKPEMFPKKADGKNVNFKDAWGLLKGNRALQMYMVSNITDKIASQAASQSAITVMLFGIIIGNYEFNGRMQMIALVPTLLVLFYGSRIAGKGGTKKMVTLWSSICVGVSVVMVLFLIFTDPTSISVAIIPTIAFIVLHVAGLAANNALSASSNSMVPDIIDYEMYRTGGTFMPTTVSTVNSFVDKLLSSVSATVVALGVSAIGYVSVQPQPGDPSTSAVFWMTMFLWKGLPIIGWLCNIIAMRFYPLDKEKMAEVQQKNHEYREAAKATPVAVPSPKAAVAD